MRYAYALSTAFLLSAAAAGLTINHPAGAQTAQNEPGAIQAAAPRAGAPTSFADMVAKLQPAVVNISTSQRVTQNANPFAGTPFELFGFGGPGRPVTREAESLGSGFIISPDGYIVTNNHVISAGQRGATVESITVTLSDRREFKAKLVGRDEQSDLAVLKIEGENLPFVKFGNSGDARVGDWVVAIGNPFGIGSSVTAGIVSAVHRVTSEGAYDRFIQTDASINRGNSGGPLFDLHGNVIGINSQIMSPTGGNVGIGFAIPADEARPIVDALMKGEAIERGYLGVYMQRMTDDFAKAFGVPANRGTIITQVEAGSPAAKAGIKAGDVIIGVSGKEVTPDQSLSYLIARTEPGKRIPIELIRDGKRMTVNVTVENRAENEVASFDADDNGPGNTAPESAAAGLGISVTPLTPNYARQLGLDPQTRAALVLGVDPSSEVAAKGLQRGDVIHRVGRTPVTSAGDIAAAVAQAKRQGQDRVVLFVQRRSRPPFFLTLEIPD